MGCGCATKCGCHNKCGCNNKCNCKKKRRNRRRGILCSCSDSNIRAIRQSYLGISTIYTSDADLRCSGLCRGIDSDIVYDWQVIPLSGNVEVVGDTHKVGDNRLILRGSGEVELTSRVTFKCRISGGGIETCIRTLTRRFKQNPPTMVFRNI